MKHFLDAIFNLLLNLRQFSREHSIWKINVSIAFQVCFWWRITAIFQLWKCLCCSCIYWEVSFTWTSLIIDLHPTTDRGVPFQLSPGPWVPIQNVLQSRPFPVLFLHGPQDYSVGSFSADRHWTWFITWPCHLPCYQPWSASVMGCCGRGHWSVQT